MEKALGHKDIKERKIKRKECPRCGALSGLRLSKCVECYYLFTSSKKIPQKFARKYKKLVENWETLEKGDEVYIQTNDMWDSEDSSPVDMGYCGEATILNIVRDGLKVYTPIGFMFIDTITDGRSKNNIVRNIPKIWKK